MKISALASGSSGNCYYVENADSAVLVDAGLSMKQVLEKLSIIKKSPDNIRGILITHEHTDHIRGADILARNLGVPVYATKPTIKKSHICSDKGLIQPIKNDETFSLGGMDITAIPKSHSAADPVSFIFKSDSSNKQALIATDLGYICKYTEEAISDSDLLFLESNHDVRMLQNGPYLPFHKKWVLSNEGHLSNTQSALAVLEHSKQTTKHIILSHLSKVNNTSQVALSTFKNLLKERSHFHPQVSISSREMPTPLFSL